jgi:uncharacterized protein (TIRG00374 family)
MLKISPPVRPALRLLAILASTGLLVYLVWHAGPGNLWHNLVRLGWGFTLVIVLAGVSHLARTWAWQMTLGQGRHKLSFPKLVGLRLGAEAAGQLGIVGQTFGDSIRVSHLSRQMQMGHSLASVTLDRGLYLVTGIIVIISGLIAALPVLSFSHALRWYAGLFALGSITFLSLTLLVLRKRLPVLSQGARLIGGIPTLKNWIEQRLRLIQSTESALFDFHHNNPRLFWGSLLLNLAGHCLAILEVCVVLWLLGAHIGFVAAMIIESLTKLVNAIGSFNPGNIGTYESGNMLIGKIFNLNNAAGLALAMARRLRALFWTAVGAICLFILTRSRSRGKAKGCGTMPDVTEKDTDQQSDPDFAIAPGSDLAVAIFLSTKTTTSDEFESELARVGSIPVLLRNILAARKLGPSRIIVAIDDTALRRRVQRELRSTRRLPQSVQWIDAKADVSVWQRLHLIAQGGSKRLVIIDGNTIYHPSLLQETKDWDKESAGVVLHSGDKHVGLYAFNAEAICDFQKHDAMHSGTLQELLARLAEIYFFTDVQVTEDLWQHVDTEGDRLLAERKLDRWLVKPTDGIYARLNRRISIPISRQLIKFPITANMVTIFTLAVGFASGAFFALGGYWNTLLGALLCLFASILDGCDGEVARLKLQESAFGCWLETVCDYLFYLILFAGMTIGLWRSSGSSMYLACGALLLFGAIASFLAAGWQRHRLAAERPEQVLKIWQTQAESRSSNPFLYFGRHTEFIVRRCFFPYALLFFALLNIMNVAFVLSAVGANLVWSIALYSSRIFSGAQRSAPTSSTALGWAGKGSGNYQASLP